jgi:hypothetical protein
MVTPAEVEPVEPTVERPLVTTCRFGVCLALQVLPDCRLR